MRNLEDLTPNRLGIYSQARTLYFFDDVDNYAVSEALRLLQIMVNNEPKKPIQIMLSTRGGDVYDGLALYDFLRFLKCDVTVIGTGIVASMGVIILLGGNKRYGTKNARFMSHQISTHFKGKCSDAKIDFIETSDLEKICDGIISERTGQSIETIELDLKKGDNYFGSEVALQRGYIHKII